MNPEVFMAGFAQIKAASQHELNFLPRFGGLFIAALGGVVQYMHDTGDLDLCENFGLGLVAFDWSPKMLHPTWMAWSFPLSFGCLWQNVLNQSLPALDQNAKTRKR